LYNFLLFYIFLIFLRRKLLLLGKTLTFFNNLKKRDIETINNLEKKQ
jgi:hypothetical protein